MEQGYAVSKWPSRRCKPNSVTATPLYQHVRDHVVFVDVSEACNLDPPGGHERS